MEPGRRLLLARRELLALGAAALALPVRAGPRLLPDERAALRALGPEPGLWGGAPAARARLAALLDVLDRATEQGLDPLTYDPEGLRRLARSDADRAMLERAATASFFAYARDVRRGRDLPGLPPRASLPGEEPAALLAALAAAPDPAAWLARLPPATAPYARLVRLLAELRAVAAGGGWTPVPPLPRLAPGESHPAIPLLRRRLSETGDLVELAAGEVIDAALAAAIRSFQARHGLVADGILGPRTSAALAVPVEARIRQVILALERRRRVPPELGSRHLFVNVADFVLELVDRVLGPNGERTVATRPVIVGTRYHQTPTFAARLTEIVLNPYWNVPRSIALGEFLPQIREDPGWLARNRMVVLDEAGRRVDPQSVPWPELGRGRFPYRLRQEPGEDNALGRIKFEMPNPHGVYLHDTPARELFERPVRTFSHGCIRVADPLGLAELLLLAQGVDRSDLEGAIASGRRHAIRVREPPLVYVTYLTAFVNADGTEQFRDDVYGRDERLARQLGLPGRDHRPPF